jgi:hypothetical protein
MAQQTRFINGTEYAVLGLQRSGNHAVIHWLLAQTRGDAHFISDIRAGANPYKTMQEFEHYRDGRRIHQQNLWTDEDRAAFAAGPYGGELTGNWRPRDTVLYNFEDQPPARVAAPEFTERLPGWIGPSRRRIWVMILRDPFNLFASRLHAGRRLTGIKNMDRLRDLWTRYARRFRNWERAGAPDRVAVNFSRWHVSRRYRRALAERLGVAFTDAGRQEVPEFLGSSFDAYAYAGRAAEMRVNRRWESALSSPVFETLTADAEAMALARDLFGDVPGVDEALEALGVGA